MEKAPVSVKIYNNTYVLRTSAAEEQVLKVAQEVDHRMQSLSEAKNITHTEKLAIWTALDLSADLQAERTRGAELAISLNVRETENKRLVQELEEAHRQSAELAERLQLLEERCQKTEKACQQLTEHCRQLDNELQSQQSRHVQTADDLQEEKERYERLLAAVRER